MPSTSRLLPLAFLSALLFALLAPPQAQAAMVAVAVTVAPPPLPIYAQPPLPAPGYIWVPGYWAWGRYGYYWVPGTWLLPPAPGLLWTPGFWSWNPDDDDYVWHVGYWAPEVGFYGGIDYGFGYFGVGYAGGYWRDHRFYYNRALNNFGGVHITNNYYRPVHNVAATRIGFNGGRGGVQVRPTPAEEHVAHARHFERTAAQRRHDSMASARRDLFLSVNHGRPPIAATRRAAAFPRAEVSHARPAGTRPYAHRQPRHAIARPRAEPHDVRIERASPFAVKRRPRGHHPMAEAQGGSALGPHRGHEHRSAARAPRAAPRAAVPRGTSPRHQFAAQPGARPHRAAPGPRHIAPHPGSHHGGEHHR